LANQILSEEHAEGTKIVVDAHGNEFAFTNVPN